MGENRKRLMQTYSRLEAERKQFESIWQEAYEFASPENACVTKKFKASDLFSGNLYATTARRSLPFFIGIMHSAIMPSNEMWHRLAPPTKELKDDLGVCAWYQHLTDVLFEYRYKPQAGFNESMISNWKSEGIVGHGITMIDDDAGQGIFYENIPVQNFLFERDRKNRLKTVFWTLDMSGEDLLEELDANNIKAQEVMPPKVYQDAKEKPDRLIPVIYSAVRLKGDEVKSARKVIITANGTSTEIAPRYKIILMLKECGQSDKGILRVFYSRTMPFTVSPYDKLVAAQFSSAPTISCLADLKMKNRIRKSNITGAERAADPTVLAMKDSGLGGLKPRAGAVIHGGMTLDAEGRPIATMQPLNLSGNLQTAFDMESVVEEEIGEYFLKPLYFLFYGQQQPKTATEINQLAMERGKMMSILSCPVERHLIYPMVERELDILFRQGKFPQNMPEKVKKLFENGEPFFAVEYEGEVKRSQLMKQAAGIMQTVEVAGQIAAFDPTVKHSLKWRDTVNALAKTNDMPLELLRDEAGFNQKVNEEIQKKIQMEQIRAMGNAAEQARTTAQQYNIQSYGV